jgi:hypothetical protein
MILFMAAVLAIGDAPTGIQWEDDGFEGFVRLRGGAWISRGFEFKTLRADSIQVSSDGQALWSGGADGGFTLLDHYVLFATYEMSLTDDVTSLIAGACVGFRERSDPGSPVAVPSEVMLYAGPIWGTFEIDASGFGDFEDAWGFRAGASFTWQPSPGIAGSLIAEYRVIEFEYELEVAEGDSHAGGSTVWIGMAVDFRF